MRRLAFIAAAFCGSCQHHPVLDLSSALVCTTDQDEAVQCAETRTAVCTCLDCSCGHGYRPDLNSCSCVEEETPGQGLLDGYLNGLEQLNTL